MENGLFSEISTIISKKMTLVHTNLHHYQMENGLFSEISTIISKKMTLVHTKVSKFKDNPII